MDNLEQFIRDLNSAWINQKYNDLYHYFHKNAVILLPNSPEVQIGVEKMVESYRQFNSMGTIHDFEIVDIKSFQFGHIIMCHLEFKVDYEIDSGRFREKGLEIYAVDHQGSSPVVVWRNQVSLGDTQG